MYLLLAVCPSHSHVNFAKNFIILQEEFSHILLALKERKEPNQKNSEEEGQIVTLICQTMVSRQPA